MNKAILVIDMPYNCGACPCVKSNDDEGEIWCGITGEAIYTTNKTHMDCPLRQVPEKDDKCYQFEWSNGYKNGWNDCINYLIND